MDENVKLEKQIKEINEKTTLLKKLNKRSGI